MFLNICRRLESVKLGGLAKVTEAGYSSILHSCRNLKKFEVLTSPLLSDSVFDNMIGVARFCDEVTEVTDAAIQILMDRPNHNSSQLQRLVLCNCRGLSADAMMLPLPQHAFRGLL
ncbi:hypothetical protein BC332_20193 [Capsicum chinense]|nr:hypothetical protein BC332_20193 [Capsicum chinense]